MSLQQQQPQSQQRTNQLQRHRSNSDDLQKPLRTQLFPNKGQHKSTLNQEEQAREDFRRHISEECGDHRLTPIELKLRGKPADSSVMSNSYPIYVHRPRGSSNSSQTTITTSVGKLSLNEGNNNCRSESALAANDVTTAQTNYGPSRKQMKLDLIVINDRKIKTSDATSKDTGNENNVTCQGKFKQNVDGNCAGQRSGNSIVAVTKRLKPRTTAIGVLTKTIRSFSLPYNTKSIFASQQKQSEDIHETAINRLSSHVSIESAKSTISDSSLQDLDETEFVGSELARYMGELNQQRLVR
jgi:hypothetical protein